MGGPPSGAAPPSVATTDALWRGGDDLSQALLVPRPESALSSYAISVEDDDEATLSPLSPAAYGSWLDGGGGGGGGGGGNDEEEAHSKRRHSGGFGGHGAAAGAAAAASTPWLLTAAVMVADMLGLGTLALPASFARLGWAPGLSVLLLLAAGCVYSGRLYQRLCAARPRAVVFDEIGGAALGRLGRALTYATIYASIACQPVVLHLTCVETLRQALAGLAASGLLVGGSAVALSERAAALVVAALVVPLSQLRHLEEVAWVSLAGTAGMLGAAAVVVGKLVSKYLAYGGGVPSPRAPPTELVATGGMHAALVGAMDLYFAFGGQINWLRYITTMRERRRFPSVVTLATAAMTLVYLATAVAGYATFGAAIDRHKPVSSLLGADAWTAAMNLGIFLHCLIAYIINVNVCCSLALYLAHRTAAGSPAARRQQQPLSCCARRSQWLAATAVCVAYGGAAGLALPFFNLILAVVASLGDVMSMLGLPALFALFLPGVVTGRGERALLWAALLLSAALTVAGLSSSVAQLAAALAGRDGSGD